MIGLGSVHVTCGPMRGMEIKFHWEGTHIHTYGHYDSMTESAQWADSVKIKHNRAQLKLFIYKAREFSLVPAGFPDSSYSKENIRL